MQTAQRIDQDRCLFLSDAIFEHRVDLDQHCIILDINLSNVDSLLSHLMVFLDQVIYFTALINLVYFIYHTRKGKLFTIRIKRLRWMFCLGIDH